MPSTQQHRETFRRLHESGCFVIPNPWDAGSAIALRQLGFPAVATTSAGFAFSRGLPDEVSVLTRDMVLAHVADIVAAADLPVNADFQNGYGADANAVAESVRRCVATGVAGLSIEDATGDPARPLYELPQALDRLQAARAVIDAGGSGVLLTARAECFLVGHADPLRESIRRLQAYAEAGADVLYAPGPKDRDEIRAIAQAVAPKPVNVLVSSNVCMRVIDLAELGVRRISVGSAMARAAWGGFLRAAKAIAEKGVFGEFANAASFDELNAMFGRQ